MSGPSGIKLNIPMVTSRGVVEVDRAEATMETSPVTADTLATAADVRGLALSRDQAALRLGPNALPAARTASTQAASAARGLTNDVADPEFAALINKLIEMGLLKGPPAAVTQGAFEQGVKNAVGQAMQAAGPNGTQALPSDLEELMALIDSLLQKEAHRRNGDKSRFQQSNNALGAGAVGSSYSPRSTGAPATQPMVPINPNAPAPGRINEAIAASAQAYMGTSTRGGPDGGNLACAWSVNNILRQAGIRQLGDNPNAVASARAALEGGRGVRIDPKDVRAGDIVIWPPPRSHIGIAGGNGVLHNSSSRAAFVNNTAIPAGASIYRITN